MKRGPFIGAAAATTLTACGGRVSHVLPGLAPSSSRQAAAAALAAMKATPAPPIPKNVLAQPIIGEAWRFDGTVAPPGWALAQGQQLPIAENRVLFSMYGTHSGGDGKTTFALPLSKVGLVIAVAGVSPVNGQVFAQTGRHPVENSLGDPAARPAVAKMPTVSPELAADRRVLLSQVRAAGRPFVPLSTDERAHVAQAGTTARNAALALLSAANRTRLLGAVDAVVAGTQSVNDAITALRQSLSGDEAAALLRANDAYLAEFRNGWAGMAHEDPQLDAARFAVSVAFTPAQVDALVARESL